MVVRQRVRSPLSHINHNRDFSPIIIANTNNEIKKSSRLYPTGLITTFALRIEPFRPSVAPIVSIILVLRVLAGDKAKSSMAAIFESDLVVFDLRGNGKV